MAAEPFATIEQITAATGVTVSATTRTLAAQDIELHTGLIEEVERTDISRRDRYFLKQACAYQAAWLADDPDHLTRRAVAATSQDGQSVTPGNADWLTLAPLARKALKRLSWRGVRTVSTSGRATILNVNSDEYEDALHWEAV